jgi:hypothetical protein
MQLCSLKQEQEKKRTNGAHWHPALPNAIFEKEQ